MSQCPQCGEDLVLPNNTQINVDNYHKPVVSITLCCGKLVNVAPISSYRVSAYTGSNIDDDWGRKGK